MKTNHSQDTAHFKPVVKWIIAGAVTGTFIGILALAGIIPGDKLLPICRIVIKAGIGLIILIIDVLFVLAFCRPRIRDYIEKHGKQTDGVIEDVNETVRPDQYGSDEWVRKAIFSVTVKYHARGKEYRKVFSLPHPTSRQALYPIPFEAGQEIPVKYPERFPALAELDPEGLKRVWYTENKKSKIPVIMIPMIITALYIIAVILI